MQAPIRIVLLLALSFFQSLWGQEGRPSKWEKDIAAFEASDKTNPPPKGAILFIGSSSIRLWKSLAQDFPEHKVINRGFGGSEIIDSVQFAERVVFPYEPKHIILYAGGNDINGGKMPERVFEDFKAFVAKVRQRLPNSRISYISSAPNPARWAQVEKVKRLNGLIQEYTRENPKLSFIDVFPRMLGEDGNPLPDIFLNDRLHMNAKGYAIWTASIRPMLEDGAASPRQSILLDGVWQLAEGRTDQPPAKFDRKVPVPGLVDLAEPPFARDAFNNKKRRFGPEDAELAQRCYWYRREFSLQGEVPVVATLLVRKAAFGSTIYLNGMKIGESLASFTANYYDARPALRGNGAANELLIGVGGSRASLPPSVPTGWDFEKKSYIPGIFDSVELVLSGTPNILNVQAAPDIANKSVEVQAKVRNAGVATSANLSFIVGEARSGKVVGKAETPTQSLDPGAEKTVAVRIPITDCRLWSPEDPFLYNLEVSTGADTYQTRFGMRELRFEARQGERPGRAYLNGKPYFLRGSNVTLYRFLEDPDRAELPWNEDWVRTLHRRFKDMHWNSLRYCIGFPPEAWYRLADEEGIMIQDEFPIWEGGGNQWPRELRREELARQYTAWMEERWNHPCVVIWDAQNESVTTETGAALMDVRHLDLSNRPWDNGWSPVMGENDICESHPYHFGDASMKLSRAISDPVGMPWAFGNSNPGNRHAFIINEYGWLWLNRDGTPTTLTKNVYANLAGKDAPPSKLLPLAARLLAAETEFWRCRRQSAGVLHFCGLGYSRPDGQTSDHWLDLKKLEWEPEFYRYARDAFAPVGLMIDFAKERVLSGTKSTRIPVVVINDLEAPWEGPVTLRLKSEGSVLLEQKQDCRLESWGQAILNFELKWPTKIGPCQLEAELTGAEGKPVRSLRDSQIIDTSALGLTYQKRVTASSVHSAAYVPANAVDGDLSTYWSSSFADPAWFAVDLGSVQKISLVRITWETAYSKAFSVQVSSDGQGWTDVYTTTAGKGGVSEIKFAPVPAHHVRVTCTKRGTQWGHAIRELEVYN